MKKAVSLLIAASLFVSSMIGFGSTVLAEEAAADASENSFKIGFAYADPSFGEDPYLTKYNVEYACDALGCELVFVGMTSFSPDDFMTAYENLAQSGCDAIICIAVFGSVIEMLEERGIYWCTANYEIDDPDLIEMCKNSEYYVGDICQDEVVNGYEMTRALYEAGCRNIAYVGQPAGTSSPDNRCRGIEQFVSEHDDLNLVTSVRDDLTKWSDSVEQILTSYQELDGLVATDNMDSATAPIYQMGKEGQVKYASCNLGNDTKEQLEDGFMIYVSMGQQYTNELAVTLLYNALTGYKDIIPDDVFAFKTPYVALTSVDDYDDFETYLAGELPAYNEEELKYLCGAFNEGIDSAEIWNRIQEYAGSYSLADVVARHEGQI